MSREEAGVRPGGTLTAAKILIVDDELPNVQFLEELLARNGHTAIRSTT